MTESQIPKLLEEYERLSRAIAIERGKRFCQQWEIDKCEDRMAAIETQFQRSGYDINTYL
jgi:hypothetical protein